MVLDEKRAGLALELNDTVIKNMSMGATFKDYVRLSEYYMHLSELLLPYSMK